MPAPASAAYNIVAEVPAREPKRRRVVQKQKQSADQSFTFRLFFFFFYFSACSAPGGRACSSFWPAEILSGEKTPARHVFREGGTETLILKQSL